MFLECEEGNSQCLTEADNQQPDGNQLIDSAHKRKGVVYVVNGSIGKKVGTTPETSDEELPAFDLSGKSSAKQVCVYACTICIHGDIFSALNMKSEL